MSNEIVATCAGVVGRVYAGPTARLEVDFFVEDDPIDQGVPEGTVGWMQVSASTRVPVVRTRVARTMCVWKKT